MHFNTYLYIVKFMYSHDHTSAKLKTQPLKPYSTSMMMTTKITHETNDFFQKPKKGTNASIRLTMLYQIMWARCVSVCVCFGRWQREEDIPSSCGYKRAFVLFVFLHTRAHMRARARAGVLMHVCAARMKKKTDDH